MTTAEKPARTPTEYPHIERDHKGRPVIKGTRFRVSMVVRCRNGIEPRTPEQIAEDYEGVLTLPKVFAALAYYHDHRSEIDDAIAAENRFVDEMEPKFRDPAFEAMILERAKQKGLLAS